LGYQEAIRVNIRALIERSKREYVSPYEIAIWYALINENDNTFKWLNKAYEVHDDNVPLLRLEPGLRSIRSDPRLTDLVRRMGLPQ
jgi:adenylate cyclase